MLNVQPQKYTPNLFTFVHLHHYLLPVLLQEPLSDLLFSKIMSHSSQSTLLLSFRLIFVPLSTKNKQANPLFPPPPPQKKKTKLKSKNPETKTHKELVDMCLTLITWNCGCLHMSKLRVYTVNTYSSLWKTSHSNKVKNKTTPASPLPWVKSRIHYGLLTGSHMRKPPFSSVISSRVHFPFFIMLQPHWFSLFYSPPWKCQVFSHTMNFVLIFIKMS